MPYECKPKQFCNDSAITYSVDWDSNTSLHNWVEQLDLTCANPDDVGFIGSSYFIGVMVSVLILPRLSDLVGRKWPVLVCSFVQLPCYFWLFWMTSLMELYIIFVLMGLAFGGTISINSLYV